jgi:putative NADH-flavin reductase
MSMKVLILGATGGTGLQLVRRALYSGHEVTAFVRNDSALQYYKDQIKIDTGDPLNPVQLTNALRGQDAVLSGLGPRVPIAKSDEHLLSTFATSLAAAMERSRVRRLVIISSAFLFKDAIFPPAYLLGRLMFPSVVKDTTDLENIVRKSDTDWTIVRPPQLTDQCHTGRYRERVGHLPFMGLKISRADVADYFVKALSLESVVHKIVGISN